MFCIPAHGLSDTSKVVIVCNTIIRLKSGMAPTFTRNQIPVIRGKKAFRNAKSGTIPTCQ